jgi:very-short-patch-repair endonuclease
MEQYEWKCENYSECSNTFHARPRDVFRDDSKSQTKYCDDCKHKERGKIYQKNMLEKNGSIQTKIPDITDIWCEDNIFKPDELTDYSHKTVSLKCPNKSAKHPEYKIKVYNIQESNCFSCPKCSVKTSKAEMRIYSELKYLFQDVKWQEKIEGKEADITIEDIKLIIEVDGFPWHYEKNDKDLKKNDIFKDNGYDTLRIRDPKLLPIICNNIICDISNFTFTDFNTIINWINNKYNLKLLNINEFNIDSIYNNLLKNVLNINYEESLEFNFPESKKVWNYEKNNPFLPSDFTPGSHVEVWINCNNGHSYKRPIKQLFRIRIKDNAKRIMNCPECYTNQK